MPSGSPPVSLQPAFENIPAALRRERIWVVWRWELIRDRWSKVPYMAGTTSLVHARSDNPETWRSYAQAWSSWREKQMAGIGSMRNGQRLFLDLDGCLEADESGIPAKWSTWGHPGPPPQLVVETLAPWAWAEYSPSGLGIHLILADVTLPPGRRQFDFAPHTGVAFYDGPRFFALTGRTLPSSQKEPLGPPAEVIGELWREFVAVTGKTQPGEPRIPRHSRAPGTRFERLLRFEEIAALYRGEWEGRYPSQSEAELAFFTKLARHGFSSQEAEDIYLRSGLARPKWLRASYANPTLTKAFEGYE